MMPSFISQAIIMGIAAGSPTFKRTNRALFFSGFSCFALLYSVQPLMPLLGREFALTAAQSSLALSVSTAALAVSLLLSSLLSDRIGRKPLMGAALTIAALMTVLCAVAQNYGQFLVMRALLGFALGGMPAVAMTYLSEEIEPGSLGLSMGLLIGGNAFGGMAGRILVSVMSDFFSWRVAMAAMGVAGLLAAAEFYRSLPRSRNFRPAEGGLAELGNGLRRQFTDDGMPWLFGMGFLLMGCMVSAYNFIGFRLLGEPFGLRQSVVGAISLFYLLGMFSSVWAGRLADKLGRRRVLWWLLLAMLGGMLATLSGQLVLMFAGLALFTFCFFASHSVTSSWVGRRAQSASAMASALYLFFYYLGSAVIGWLAGVAWGLAGWAGVIGLLGSALAGALLIALRLRNLAPAAPAGPAQLAAA
ncbi:MFS transporter [Massilia sp. Root351]|jgi:YNFM family putative membrane transporter|uniref:MFS transporter n=1 Tax=Massilia sp. Root351 TaxID=1736522 RepID=UPI0009EBFCBE|nr:MFS transporter [Massilia sp. Root351]